MIPAIKKVERILYLTDLSENARYASWWFHCLRKKISPGITSTGRRGNWLPVGWRGVAKIYSGVQRDDTPPPPWMGEDQPA